MILGYLSNEQGVEISELVSTGQGLAFVSYPTAIAKMGAYAPAAATKFGTMMMCLGMNHCSGQQTLRFFLNYAKRSKNVKEINFFRIRINVSWVMESLTCGYKISLEKMNGLEGNCCIL